MEARDVAGGGALSNSSISTPFFLNKWETSIQQNQNKMSQCYLLAVWSEENTKKCVILLIPWHLTRSSRCRFMVNSRETAENFKLITSGGSCIHLGLSGVFPLSGSNYSPSHPGVMALIAVLSSLPLREFQYLTCSFFPASSALGGLKGDTSEKSRRFTPHLASVWVFTSPIHHFFTVWRGFPSVMSHFWLGSLFFFLYRDLFPPRQSNFTADPGSDWSSYHQRIHVNTGLCSTLWILSWWCQKQPKQEFLQTKNAFIFF